MRGRGDSFGENHYSSRQIDFYGDSLRQMDSLWLFRSWNEGVEDRAEEKPCLKMLGGSSGLINNVGSLERFPSNWITDFKEGKVGQWPAREKA